MGGRSKPIVLIGILCGILLSSACVTVSKMDIQRATDRVDAEWGAENAATFRSEGSREVNVPRPEAIEAARHALEQIGFNVVEVDTRNGKIRAERDLVDSDISEEVRRIEEPRLRQIYVDEIGVMGMSARLEADDYRLYAVASVEPSQNGALIKIERLRNEYLGEQNIVSTDQLAPAALKAGLYEFWNAIDKNVEQILADRPVVTDVRKSPSEWVLPPRN